MTPRPTIREPHPRKGFRLLLATLASALLAAPALASADLVPVEGGLYESFYPIEGEGPTEVAPFEIQARPVTNADYLAFVAERPEWDRGAPPAVFSEPGHLAHWAGPSDLGDALPDAPVTNVSWFAAGAYCEAAGLRLPTEAEWELVARADATRLDASDDPARKAELLASYASRGGPLGPAASGEPNAYGVHDLHASIWEWVEDPGSTIAMNDSRNAVDRDVSLVCGGASLGARDRTDYPAFLRHATRAGLGPASANAALGFRCAN